jgi:hypothetical protein
MSFNNRISISIMEKFRSKGNHILMQLTIMKVIGSVW